MLSDIPGMLCATCLSSRWGLHTGKKILGSLLLMSSLTNIFHQGGVLLPCSQALPTKEGELGLAEKA